MGGIKKSEFTTTRIKIYVSVVIGPYLEYGLFVNGQKALCKCRKLLMSHILKSDLSICQMRDPFIIQSWKQLIQEYLIPLIASKIEWVIEGHPSQSWNFIGFIRSIYHHLSTPGLSTGGPPPDRPGDSTAQKGSVSSGCALKNNVNKTVTVSFSTKLL